MEDQVWGENLKKKKKKKRKERKRTRKTRPFPSFDTIDITIVTLVSVYWKCVKQEFRLVYMSTVREYRPRHENTSLLAYIYNRIIHYPVCSKSRVIYHIYSFSLRKTHTFDINGHWNSWNIYRKYIYYYSELVLITLVIIHDKISIFFTFLIPNGVIKPCKQKERCKEKRKKEYHTAIISE